MRIVSLLPSATEIICAHGLENELVGVTHECDYPAFVAHLPKVTRTLIPDDASSREIDSLVSERLKTQRALYTLDMPTLERLAPDLIVTQTLCEVCAVAEAEVSAAACVLPGRPKVVHLEPTRLQDVLQTLHTVAAAAGIENRAEGIVNVFQRRIDVVVSRSERITTRPYVVLLEWLDPPFCSGHWSPELVRLAGGEEVIGRAGQPSRRLRWEEVIAARPNVLLIACCGFSVARRFADIPILITQLGSADTPALRDRQVYIVDGSAYFSRPGPRLVDSLEILAHVLHPEIHPLPPGLPTPLRFTADQQTAAR